MARKIGAITVGQSPRTDVVGELGELLQGIELVQRGALDGLTADEIKGLAPVEGDYVLVTKLRDGSSVRIAEKFILERIQKHIADLENEGVEGILMLCTGEFPAFKTKLSLLYPQKLLQHFVAGVAGAAKVGVFTPDISQVPQASKRWKANGCSEVFVEPASPYGDPAAVYEAALKLRERGAELLVMDCIGYTWEMKRRVMQDTGLPVVLPRTAAARVVAEMYG